MEELLGYIIVKRNGDAEAFYFDGWNRQGGSRNPVWRKIGTWDRRPNIYSDMKEAVDAQTVLFNSTGERTLVRPVKVEVDL